MGKTRINISMDRDLAEFVKAFAVENRTTVADIVTQYVLSLKRQVEGQEMKKVLSHPAVMKAMKKAKKKLRNSKNKWHIEDETIQE